MNFVELLYPVVYTSLFGFAVLFLVTTPNSKFYPKILFTFFVSSLGVWGWSELLLNHFILRNYIYPLIQVGFFSAEVGTQILFLIGLELLGFKSKKYRLIIIPFLLLSLLVFLPNFMVFGYVDLETHVNLIPGYGNMLYVTEILLFALVALFLFAIPYRRDDELTRKRINPILFASIFSIFVGVFFNIFLPEVYNIEQFTSVAPLAVVSVVVSIAYSIYKWNLLGITLNESVSYSQISQMWKLRSPDLYRSIRETFFLSLEYFPAGITAQKLFFPAGKVNKKGNVYLFNSQIYNLIYLYYLFLRKIMKGRIFILKDKENFFIIVTNQKTGSLPPDLADFIIKKFSTLSLYQKSAENIFERHLVSSEPERPI